MSALLDEKSVRKYAQDLINQRITKQAVYEQLAEEFGYQATIAKIVKGIPSVTAWKKYGIWNHVLSGLMILLFLLMILGTPTIGTVIWYGLPIVAIIMRKTRFYFWVAVLAGIGLITMVAIFLNSPAGIQSDEIIKIGLFLLLLVPSAFLAIWLPGKLCPSPEESREIYENENGEQRSRIVFKFSE